MDLPMLRWVLTVVWAVISITMVNQPSQISEIFRSFSLV